jgi:hypothetical protein
MLPSKASTRKQRRQEQSLEVEVLIDGKEKDYILVKKLIFNELIISPTWAHWIVNLLSPVSLNQVPTIPPFQKLREYTNQNEC